MSEKVSDLGEDEVLPSFEAAHSPKHQVLLTRDASRLYWVLEDPLSNAIRVMDDKYYDPDAPITPYCDQTGPSPKWSPVSQSPLTDPKISSVTVHVEQLDEWEDDWFEFHRDHAHPDGLYGAGCDARFGPLPDYDPREDEEGPVHLLRCCHADRPRKMKVSLVVEASGQFLTVHDYVSAVHPWLMSHRENIFKAAGNLDENVSLPADTRLIVPVAGTPELIWMYEEKDWQRSYSRKRNLEFQEQLKAWKVQKAVQDREAWELKQILDQQ